MKNHHRSSASSLRIQSVGAGTACIGNPSCSSPEESPQYAITGRRVQRGSHYSSFRPRLKSSPAPHHTPQDCYTADMRRPDWFAFHIFRNTCDPRDIAITDRRQNAPLPKDARWTYYATFASPIKAVTYF